jgi:hypothetical protein
MNFYLGYDAREDVVYQVARASLLQSGVNVIPLVQDSLRAHRIYTREVDRRAVTDFSLTRFMVPYLESGTENEWSFFADCDFLFTRDLSERLDALLDDRFAVMVVKHDYQPRNPTKMGGLVQHRYPRKNWSSFIAWNLKHEANKALDIGVVNAADPSWLHQFQWLDDNEIGALPLDFNFLVGEYEPIEKNSETLIKVTNLTPTCLHYTLGIGPYVPPVKDYAALWEAYRQKLPEMTEPMRRIQ